LLPDLEKRDRTRASLLFLTHDMALSTLFSGIHVASSFFQKIFPVPGFISSLSSLQALLGFGGWTLALVASYVTFRYVFIHISHSKTI
jgi:hypothetical protein